MWTNEEIYNAFHESWHPILDTYMKYLKKVLATSGQIYPPKELIFRVFQMPLEDIAVVILGQDPYHGHGQATGLAFDCSKQNKQQPSLTNMFKEIMNEFPERNYNLSGNNLLLWRKQGIFLLNTALTVKSGQPKSLVKQWSHFTDAVIQYIADYNEKCVFLLMGGPAKQKSDLISCKTRIVTCVHPSPFSAYSGFFGSNAFIKVEEKLGYEIDWSVTENEIEEVYDDGDY